MQFDPHALKSLVNDPDNEKFTFFEKKNDWLEIKQFDQLNEQSAEKICPSETEYVRPQIYNAEGAKKATNTAKLASTMLALAAAGTLTVATTILNPTSSYKAEIVHLSATENAIYYEVESENWDENADLSIVVYNGNKQIYRVDKMDFALDVGEQTDLPKGVYFTVEVKDGNVSLAKQKIKTINHTAK